MTSHHTQRPSRRGSDSTSPIDWSRARAEALGFLKDLIRIDTTNPPGNERPAADYVAAVLAREGIEPTVLESEPTRASVVARLRGSGRKPPLLLSAHLDVVPAEPEHWTHPPFEAVEADGFVWGRGTIDMKNMAAASLETMLLLKRSGIALDRDVIFAGVADEEAGSKHGSVFLAENHPELIRAEYVLTEVGGHTVHVGGHRLYPIQVSEKGICWFELTAKGDPGHGSMPSPKNAVVRLARAVKALGETRLALHPTPIVEGFVNELARHSPFPQSWILPLLLSPTVSSPVLDLVMRVDPGNAMGLNAMLRHTANPTQLAAGRKVNVIPSTATATIDGRVIPGHTLDSFLREVLEVVGDDLSIRVVESHDGTIFESKTELFETIASVIGEADPQGSAVPYMIPGFTDAFAYARLGATCYGFVPIRMPPDVPFTRLYHAHDERIPVEGFGWGLEILHRVVTRFCASEPA